MMENDSWWTPQKVKCQKLLDELFAQHQYLPVKVIETELKRYNIEIKTFYQLAKKLDMAVSHGYIYKRPRKMTHELP